MEPPNILHEDILYNILLHVDPHTASNIGIINKMSNIVYNRGHFWKHIFTRDHVNVNPKSNNWKNEYIRLYSLHIKALQLISIITPIINNKNPFDRRTDTCRICTRLFCININDLQWLPLKFLTDLKNDEFSDIRGSFNNIKLKFYINGTYTEYKIFGSTTHSHTFEYWPMCESVSPSTLIKYISYARYIYDNIPFKLHDKSAFDTETNDNYNDTLAHLIIL